MLRDNERCCRRQNSCVSGRAEGPAARRLHSGLDGGAGKLVGPLLLGALVGAEDAGDADDARDARDVTESARACTSC